MGVLNLDQMNTTLLCKWVWQHFQADYTSLWKLIIKIKYKSRTSGHLSFFLKHICRLIPFMRLCIKKVVGNGQDTLFWLDNWYNDSALSVQFSILYSKAKAVDSLTLA
jgi:hypothetical protein